MSPTAPPNPGLPGLRAVVVDEWALFREGVASVLAGVGVEVVGQAATTADGLLRLWTARPDLLVAGSPANGGRLLHLVAQAKAAQPDVRVLALLAVSEAGELRPLLSSGADAVLTRTAGPADLEDTVRRLAAGERVLSADALSVLLGLTGRVDRSQDAPAHRLTPKELDVLSYLAKGLTNRGIAAALVVSEATVKSHLARIYDKLEAPGRQAAVRRAVELTILS